MRKDIYSTFHDFAIYGVGSVAMQAVSILLVPVYTQWLGLKDYGVLSLLLGIQFMLNSLSQAGLGSALFRSYYDYEDHTGQKRVITTTFWLLLPTSFSVGALTYALAGTLSKRLVFAEITMDHIQLMAIISFFEGLGILPFSVFRARRQALRFIFTTVIALLARIVAIIYFVVMLQGGLMGVLYGMLTGSLASFVLGYLQTGTSLSWMFNFCDAKRLLRFGLPLIPISITGWILAISGRYILARHVPMAQVGIYALAERLANVLNVLLVQPLGLLWLPIMLSVSRQEYAKAFYSRMFTYYILAGVFGSLSLTLLAHLALPLLSHPSFYPAEHFIFPLGLGFVAFGASRILNVGADLARTPERYLLALSIACVIFLIGCAILIPLWSVWGLVMATLCASLLFSGLVFWLSNRQYRIRFEWGRISTIVITGMVCYGFAQVLMNLSGKWFWQYLSMICTIMGYPALLWAIGVIRKEERVELEHQLARLRDKLRAVS